MAIENAKVKPNTAESEGARKRFRVVGTSFIIYVSSGQQAYE